MSVQIIYIPGLGDTNPIGQRLACNTWRLWGVRPQLFQINWADRQPLQPKLERLLQLVDRLSETDQVALVASSAGARVAINAYAARPAAIQGVVCIAGMVNSAESVNALTPALCQRILSIRSQSDPVVAASYSLLPGAINRVVKTKGHAWTIGTQLIFGAPRFLKFIKHLKPSV